MQEGLEQLTQVGIQVGGCSVTISGPLAEVVPLLNHLQAFGPEAAEPQRRSYTGAPHWLPVLLPVPLPRACPVAPKSFLRPACAAVAPSRPLSPPKSSAPVPVTRTTCRALCPRLDLAASLPDCPASWLDRASSRAWKAGAWARLVLQGAIGTPAASRQLNIPSRYYAVIGGEGVHPALYRSYRDYSRALGPIEASSAVSHAFPTELETQVYCAGAQVEWPLP